MPSFTEQSGQSDKLRKADAAQTEAEHCAVRKPAWLVLLKLLGVAAIVAVGFAIALPTLLELGGFPLWQSAAMTAGAMLVYTGIAYFIRPETNRDHLGAAGGPANDSVADCGKTSRFRGALSCLLRPGRFTAETLLDLCTLLRGSRSSQADEDCRPSARSSAARPAAEFSLDPTRPIAPLDPNLFAQSSAHYVASQIQLETQRFVTPKQS